MVQIAGMLLWAHAQLAASSQSSNENMLGLDLDSRHNGNKLPDLSLLDPIRYSSVYWPKHFAHSLFCPHCKNAMSDSGPVKNLLTLRFLPWLECVSLLGKVTDVLKALESLYYTMKVCTRVCY